MLRFDPSADPATPGILQSITNCLPTQRGIMGAPSPVAMDYPTLDDASKGAATVELLDGSRRVLIGTDSYLYEATDGGYTLAGTGFSTGDNRWMFTGFGNAIVACNGADPLVASTGSTFTGISGAPAAKIIESVGLHVMAFDCDNGTDHYPDQWWSSALGDYTDWTPSITTQSANGRFLDSPGGITAAKRIGDGIAAYKRRGLYYGVYVGGEVIWQWSQVASNAGCVGSRAIVNAGGAHVFVGMDDIWVYDGSLPRPIGGKVKKWFFADADKASLYKIQTHYDRINGHIWFFYASKASGGVLDSALIYSLDTGEWGRATIPGIADVMAYIEPGATYSGATGTYDGQPALSYDSPFWRAGAEYPAFIGTDTQPYSLTGRTSTASMTFHDLIADGGLIHLTPDEVVPQWTTAPDTATMEHWGRYTRSDAWALSSTADWCRQTKFNFRAARRHGQLRLTVTGDFELLDLQTKLIKKGR